MGLFSGLFGGDSKGSTSQTTTVQPWGEQVPYLQDIFNQAQMLYQGSGPQYYPFGTVAPVTPEQQAGRSALMQYAGSTLPMFTDQAMNAANFSLGSVLYPESNPALAAYQQSAAQPLWQGLTEQILPSIRSGATGAGQYGSSRQGIAEGLASGRTAQAVSDLEANIANQGYQSGLEAMGRALAFAPQISQMGMLPGQIMEAVGATNQQQSQAETNAAMQKWNWEQMLPYERLREFYSLVSGPFGSSSTATGLSGSTGGLPGMLAGGALGAGLGGMIGNPAGIGATFSGINGAGSLSGAAAGVSNPYTLPLMVLGSLFGAGQ